MQTLDAVLAGRQPRVIKMDVEGFELPVIRGAHKTLSADASMAVIIELNGSGQRYGFDDEVVRQSMIDHGFFPVRYDPWTRDLAELSRPNMESGNAIYVTKKSLEDIRQCLKTAPPIRVKGWEI